MKVEKTQTAYILSPAEQVSKIGIPAVPVEFCPATTQ